MAGNSKFNFWILEPKMLEFFMLNFLYEFLSKKLKFVKEWPIYTVNQKKVSGGGAKIWIANQNLWCLLCAVAWSKVRHFQICFLLRRHIKLESLLKKYLCSIVDFSVSYFEEGPVHVFKCLFPQLLCSWKGSQFASQFALPIADQGHITSVALCSTV